MNSWVQRISIKQGFLTVMDISQNGSSRCHRVLQSRFSNHCYFLCACLGFLCISSLPRLLTLLDALITSALFIYHTTESNSRNFLEVFALSTFNDESWSIFLLSLFRSVFLFFAFAYKHHLNESVWYEYNFPTLFFKI